MATITVRYPDGSTAEIEPPEDDANGRVLIGSSERCNIRLVGEGVLPIHAYLAGGGNHYGLLLAPGAKVKWNGRELSNDAPPEDKPDLSRCRWMMRDHFTFELAGAVITVHHICG